MYIPKYICTTVLLFYCSPRPAQKDYFPTKPFIPSRNSSICGTITPTQKESQKEHPHVRAPLKLLDIISLYQFTLQRLSFRS